jgi:hypothetical protein
VDLLAVTDNASGAVSTGSVSISYYTSHDLSRLAKTGSLFVLHLIREGVTLCDPCQVLGQALGKYSHSDDFADLRTDLVVVLNGLSAIDCDEFHDGLQRAGVWAARSALYVACAEAGRPTFDVEAACAIIGQPELLDIVRNPERHDLDEIRASGLRALGIARAVDAAGTDLASYAVQNWSRSADGCRLIESIIGGRSQLAYTELTLPIV